MTHKELFEEYQDRLAWINRMCEPETLKFYKQTKENWDRAKWAVFFMYQNLRQYVEGGVPERDKCFVFDDDCAKNYPPIKYKDSEVADSESGEYECPAVGELRYRGREFPIYMDDYGMQTFTIVDGHEIELESIAGTYDWYYELDKILDKID